MNIYKEINFFHLIFFLDDYDITTIYKRTLVNNDGKEVIPDI